MFLHVTAEQLSCQQSGEAAGPQIYSGPPHQYHLLQNEGTVPAFICQSINIYIWCSKYAYEYKLIIFRPFFCLR